MKPIICLMGPTASGKTSLAVEIVQRFSCEIISVDSAMVYRGMDIGTAKPDADILRIAPHRLIDFLDPKEAYSAGQFRQDALREIEAIIADNKIPLLVGGTMMYFRILQQGLATLPQADPTVRAELKSRAEKEGWESLHAYLSTVDAVAGKKINPNDSQRIQRALEVYLLTGKNMTEWQAQNTSPLAGYNIHNIILAPANREHLHERIALRFEQMLAAGLIDEVRALYERGDLTADLPSIRSVGYREVWEYFSGLSTATEMREKAIIATRQLAKRQMTWLRSWPDAKWLDALASDVLSQMMKMVQKVIPDKSPRVNASKF